MPLSHQKGEYAGAAVGIGFVGHLQSSSSRNSLLAAGGGSNLALVGGFVGTGSCRGSATLCGGLITVGIRFLSISHARSAAASSSWSSQSCDCISSSVLANLICWFCSYSWKLAPNSSVS